MESREALRRFVGKKKSCKKGDKTTGILPTMDELEGPPR